MPVVTVTGTGVDCSVSSRFAGRFAHAAARSFLRRQSLAGVQVREDARPLAGFAFEAEARRQATARDAIPARRNRGVIVCN